MKQLKSRRFGIVIGFSAALVVWGCSQLALSQPAAPPAVAPQVDTAVAPAAPTDPRLGAFDADAIARIREEGMSRSQVMKTLSYLSDVIGPRLTGSPNLRHANAWT